MIVSQERGTSTCGTKQWQNVDPRWLPLVSCLGLYNELHSSGVYDVLNHKFLTRGHTFLRNDTDFAKIKKGKASATVYVPSDWFSVVKEANHQSPFKVVPMQQEKFMNFKDHISGNGHFSPGGSTFQ